MSARPRIYCRRPRVGEKLTYRFDTNYPELVKEFRIEHGRAPTEEENSKICGECIDVWKEATVIEVSIDGRRLALQDEKGNVSDLEYDCADIWDLAKCGRNEIPINFGRLVLYGWTMRLPARVSSRNEDIRKGLRD